MKEGTSTSKMKVNQKLQEQRLRWKQIRNWK